MCCGYAAAVNDLILAGMEHALVTNEASSMSIRVLQHSGVVGQVVFGTVIDVIINTMGTGGAICGERAGADPTGPDGAHQ